MRITYEFETAVDLIVCYKQGQALFEVSQGL